MNKWTVYIHITPSGKRYIGITSNKVENRWQNGKGYRFQVFYRAILKYGWSNINHIIFKNNLSEAEAKKEEINLIKLYKTRDSAFGYNYTDGGDGALGYVFTEEQKAKLKEANTGIKNHFYGKKHSIETISKFKQPYSEERKASLRVPKPNAQGKNNHNAKAVICLDTNEVFDTIAQASIKYHIASANIIKCCVGQRKTCGKKRWAYYESTIEILISKKEVDNGQVQWISKDSKVIQRDDCNREN